ncbi:MAG: hypothetical protein LBQ40_03845 [Clostridiales bacterium]|jgi:hypothetical protein|nr:hypothetical protein [Clostridiales bacterium]
MNEQKAKRIYSAVRRDDAKTFADLVRDKDELSLCYGRFPLLSLCYLYRAKKIIGLYEDKLDAVSASEYVFAAEPLEAYQKLKAAAGKALRLYVLDGRLVTPLETLALTGDFLYLKRVYPNLKKDRAIKDSLDKIFKIRYRRPITQVDGRLEIGGIDLSKKQKICVTACLIAAVFMAALSGGGLAGLYGAFGFGTEDAPFKIYDGRQLAAVIKGGGEQSNYKLSADIELDKGWEAADFLGGLDGGGHTISLNNLDGTFIADLKGRLSNVAFSVAGGRALSVDGGIDITQEDDSVMRVDGAAFIAAANNGVIDNVTLTVSGDLTENVESLGGAFYIGLFVFSNNGEILNSTLDADVSFAGDGQGDASIAGFAAVNYATIKNCRTTEGSSIKTHNADVAGIAVQNYQDGVIDSCRNDAEIFQASDISEWSPNVAGIVLNNTGGVTSSVNNGDLSAKAENLGTDRVVYIGGIAAVQDIVVNSSNVLVGFGAMKDVINNGNLSVDAKSIGTDTVVCAGGITAIQRGAVEFSKNYADIEVAMSGGVAYVGGIAAHGNMNYASVNTTIKNSGFVGNISVNTADADASVSFIGGIAGYFYGAISDCYSAGSISSNNSSADIGGIVGLAYCYLNPSNLLSYILYYNNNYYLAGCGAVLGVAKGRNGSNYFTITAENDTGTYACQTLEELKQSGVYW